MAINPELNIDINVDDNTASGFRNVEDNVERLQRDLRKLNNQAQRASTDAIQAGNLEMQRLQSTARFRSSELQKQIRENTTQSQSKEIEHQTQLRRIDTESRSQLQSLRTETAAYQDFTRLKTSSFQDENRRTQRFRNTTRRYHRDQISHQRNLRREIQRTNQVQTSLLGTLGTQGAGTGIIGSLAGSFTAARIAAAGFGAAVVAAGVSIIRTASDYERLSRSLEAITGGADAAAAQLQDIQDIAELPGITFRDASRATVRLRAGGFGQETTNRIIREFGNAAAASGAASQDMAESVRQLTQIQSTGRITAENLNVILERLPILRPTLVDEFGTAVGGQLQKTLEAQNISFDDFIDRWLTRLESMERVDANTFQNATSNFQNAVDRLQRELGIRFLPALTTLVNILTRIVNFFNSPIGTTALVGLAGIAIPYASRGLIERFSGRRRARQIAEELAGFGIEIGAESILERGLEGRRTTTRTTTRRRTTRTGRIVGEIAEEAGDRPAWWRRAGRGAGELASEHWDDALLTTGGATGIGSGIWNFLRARSAILRHAANIPDFSRLGKTVTSMHGRQAGLQLGQVASNFDKLGMIRFSQYSQALADGLKVFPNSQISTAVKIGTAGGRFPALGFAARAAALGLGSTAVGAGITSYQIASFIGDRVDPVRIEVRKIKKEVEELEETTTKAMTEINQALGGERTQQARDAFQSNIRSWKQNLISLGVPITATAKQVRDFYDTLYGSDLYSATDPERFLAPQYLTGDALKERLRKDSEAWEESIRNNARTGISQIELLEDSMTDWLKQTGRAETDAVNALSKANNELTQLNAQIKQLTPLSAKEREQEKQRLEERLRIALATAEARRREYLVIRNLPVPEHRQQERLKEEQRISLAFQRAHSEYLDILKQLENIKLPKNIQSDLFKEQENLIKALAEINKRRLEYNEKIRRGGPASARALNRLKAAVLQHQEISETITKLEDTGKELTKEEKEKLKALKEQQKTALEQQKTAEKNLFIAKQQNRIAEQRVKNERDSLKTAKDYLNLWRNFGDWDSRVTFLEQFGIDVREKYGIEEGPRYRRRPFGRLGERRPLQPRGRDAYPEPNFEDIAPGRDVRPNQPFPRPPSPDEIRSQIPRTSFNQPGRDFIRRIIEDVQKITLSLASNRNQAAFIGAPPGLLDPQYARDLRIQFEGMSDTIRDVVRESNDFRRSDPLGTLFNRQTIIETYAYSTSIKQLRDRLVDLFVEMRSTDPNELAEEMNVLIQSIYKVQREINALGSTTSLAQFFLKMQLMLNDLRGSWAGLQQDTHDARMSLGKFFNYFGELSRKIDRRPDNTRQLQIASFLEQVGQSFYQNFGADFVLETIGLGGRSQDRVRDALADLKSDFNETAEEIARDSLISEAERLEEMKQLQEQYNRDRRSIEKQAEEERARAWRDWYKNVIVDLARVTYEQLNLQIALKATNFILQGLGKAGIGSGISGVSTAGAAAGTAATGASGVGAALGTAGTAAVGVAAAVTAINGLIDPVKDLLNSFSFHDAANDQYAMREARKAGKKITGGQTPSQYGRKSAKDLVDNIVGGLQEGMQGGNMQSGNSGNFTQIVIPNQVITKIGNREIQEVNEVSVLLDETNRLVSPGNSRVQKDLTEAKMTAAINSAIDSKIRPLQQSVTAAQTAANNAEESTRRLRQDVAGKINLGDII